MEISQRGGELITSLELLMAPDLLLHAQKSWEFPPGISLCEANDLEEISGILLLPEAEVVTPGMVRDA